MERNEASALSLGDASRPLVFSMTSECKVTLVITTLPCPLRRGQYAALSRQSAARDESIVISLKTVTRMAAVARHSFERTLVGARSPEDNDDPEGVNQ